ncbi:MAG: type II toxin-antitoxin system HicB family antitoxin [Acidimicrobiales bacterium]
MSQLMDLRYTVRVHEEDGGLWATVTEMPGLFVSGDSIDEIREALTEAMSLYMSSHNVTVQFHDLQLTGRKEVGDDIECYEVALSS